MHGLLQVLSTAFKQQAVRTRELHAFRPLHGAGHETSVGVVFDQHLQYHARCHPHERRTSSEVHAVAEGEVVDLDAANF
jgi:hypothetical protein